VYTENRLRLFTDASIFASIQLNGPCFLELLTYLYVGFHFNGCTSQTKAYISLTRCIRRSRVSFSIEKTMEQTAYTWLLCFPTESTRSFKVWKFSVEILQFGNPVQQLRSLLLGICVSCRHGRSARSARNWSK